ncbi:WD40-repeat-containing domain protein [Gaertneriomyces semiglobifer]|nr:WD40-repeat-containing domain protein [Gaertneriomyces semiglobifer]
MTDDITYGRREMMGQVAADNTVANEVSFSSRFHYNHITSLLFLSPCLALCGSGPFLQAFYVGQNGDAHKCIGTAKVLEAARVMGLWASSEATDEHVTEIKLVVSGGKWIKILQMKFQYDESLVPISFACEVKVTFPLMQDWVKDVQWIKDETAQPTHLALCFAHNSVAIYSLATLERVHVKKCIIPCILYSARFLGNAYGSLQIIVGTVFNEILIWDVFGPRAGDIQKRLRGHEGVIFNLTVDEQLRRVVSVSDDRTARVWQIDAQAPESAPITLFGHAARVWNAKFVPNSPNLLVSIGEDCTCRLWDINTRECIRVYEGHEGKNIWSVDVDPVGQRIITGGGDSGIKLWKIAAEEATHNKIGIDGTITKGFVLLGEDDALTCTEAGQFWVFLRSQNAEPRMILELSEFKHYVTFAASECGRIVVAGSKSGTLTLITPYSEPLVEQHRWQVGTGKLLHIAIRTLTQKEWLLFVFAEAHAEVLVYSITHTDAGFRVSHIADMALPDHFWVMDVGCIPHVSHICVFGSKAGAIAMYDVRHLLEGPKGASPVNLQPKCVSRRVHGKQAVTGVVIEKDNIIASVGRDGFYCRYQVHDNRTASCWELERIYRSRITKGWLEAIRCRNAGGEVSHLLTGFFDKQFFVFDERRKQRVAAVDCGGGHRLWEARILKSGALKFAYLRKHYVYTIEWGVEAGGDEILQGAAGIEGRVVRFFSINGTKMLVTSGEDGVLRFYWCTESSSSGRLTKAATVKRHFGGVRGISISNSTTSAGDLLMVTGGAREELVLWKLHEAGDGGFRCVEVSHAPRVYQEEMEVRLMDVCLAFNGKDWIIFGAYSDGYIRTWKYDGCNLTSTGSSGWHNRCVLKAKIVALDKRLLGVTAGTDGRIAIWDLGWYDVEEAVSPTPIWNMVVHQSGINALDVMIVEDQGLQIATGGDDNGLCVLKLAFDISSAPSHIALHTLSQGRLDSGHSSNITGKHDSGDGKSM